MPEDLTLNAKVTDEYETPLDRLAGKLEEIDEQADETFDIEAGVTNYQTTIRRLEKIADAVDDIDNVAIATRVQGLDDDELPDGYNYSFQRSVQGPDGTFVESDDFDIPDLEVGGGGDRPTFDGAIETLEADVDIGHFDIRRLVGGVGGGADGEEDEETSLADELYEPVLDALRQNESERDSDGDADELASIRQALEDMAPADEQVSVSDEESSDTDEATKDDRDSERDVSFDNIREDFTPLTRALENMDTAGGAASPADGGSSDADEDAEGDHDASPDPTREDFTPLTRALENMDSTEGANVDASAEASSAVDENAEGDRDSEQDVSPDPTREDFTPLTRALENMDSTEGANVDTSAEASSAVDENAEGDHDASPDPTREDFTPLTRALENMDAAEEADVSVEGPSAVAENVESDSDSEQDVSLEAYHDDLSERFAALGEVAEETRKLGRDDGTPTQRFVGDLTDPDRDRTSIPSGDVRDLTGVGSSVADSLEQEGISSIQDLHETDRDLTEVRGIGDSRAETLRTEADQYVRDRRRETASESVPDREMVVDKLDVLTDEADIIGARMPWDRIQEQYGIDGDPQNGDTWDQADLRRRMEADSADPVHERMAALGEVEGDFTMTGESSVSFDDAVNMEMGSGVSATADGQGGVGGRYGIDELQDLHEIYGEELDWGNLISRGGVSSPGELLDNTQVEEIFDMDALGGAIEEGDTGALAAAQRVVSGNRQYGDENLLQTRGIMRDPADEDDRSLMEKMSQLEPSMSQFYNALAAMLPLLLNFAFALPAAITALGALATAAVGAAGLLAGIAGLGLYGLLNTEDGFSMEPLRVRLRTVGENIKENFLPLAEDFQPLVDFGFRRLNDMIDELGGHTQLFSGFRDEARGVINFLANRIPDIIVALGRFGDAMSPIFAAIGEWMDIPAAIAWFRSELVSMMPWLRVLSGVFVSMVPQLINLSKGFLIVASFISLMMGAFLNFLDMVPYGGVVFGALIGTLMSLVGVMYLVVSVAGLVQSALALVGVEALAGVIPALKSAGAALLGYASSAWTAMVSTLGLAGAIAAVLTLTGIGIVAVAGAFGYMADQIHNATKELRGFNELSGNIDPSMGGYGGSGGGIQQSYVNYEDNSRMVVNSGGQSDSVMNTQRANYYQQNLKDRQLGRMGR